MNLKKIARTLSKIRKNTLEYGDVTPEDEDTLRRLLGSELSNFFEPEKEQDNEPFAYTAQNDNTLLTKDQKYRLTLIEKSKSTSNAIH